LRSIDDKSSQLSERDEHGERDDDLHTVKSCQRDDEREVGKLEPGQAEDMSSARVEDDACEKEVDRMLTPFRQQVQHAAEYENERSRRKPDAGGPYRDVKKQAGPGSGNQNDGSEAYPVALPFFISSSR
jgi:hypothetical protein